MRNQKSTPIPSVDGKSRPMAKPIGKCKFREIDWKKGEAVKLTNNKVYKIVGLDLKHNSLILHSDEYNKDFRADCRIILKRVKIRTINCIY